MIKINDNITLHYIPMENLKITSVGVYIYRSLTKEDASKNALLSYLFQRGCTRFPTLNDISKQLENLYGASYFTDIRKQGNIQILSLNGRTISDRYAPNGEKLTSSITELILSCLFEPITENGAFSREYVEQEKRNLKDAILSIVNDKRAYAQRRCIEEMCAGDGYALSRTGTREDVDLIDEKNLYEYYKQMITSSVIDIFVCGDADINEVSDTVRSFTDKLLFNAAPIPENNMFERKNDTIREISEAMDITQGKLCIGLTTDITCRDEQYWALMAANSVFGGGAHSKLFNNVREKLSLAYYVSSVVEKNKGLMFINAGVEFENRQKAIDEINAQLEDMKNGKITDEEMNASILAVIDSLDSYYDDQLHMQWFLMSQRISGTNYSIEYMKEQLRRVTIADVAEVSKSIKTDTIYFLEGVSK